MAGDKEMKVEYQDGSVNLDAEDSRLLMDVTYELKGLTAISDLHDRLLVGKLLQALAKRCGVKVDRREFALH